MAAEIRRAILGILCLLLVVSSVTAAAKTFYVEETDFVRLRPEGVDPDNDKIAYSYSPPLDQQGEWQTGYDDSGEYPIEITASDGKTTTTEKIVLVVLNKNQPPSLTEKKITAKETQLIDLKQYVQDPDDDLLSYAFQDPFDKMGVWEPGYDDEGSFITEFTVNDGSFNQKLRLEIEVLNTNQPPTIVRSFADLSTVETQENENLEYWVDVEEDTLEKLRYSWRWDGEIISQGREGEYFLDYNSSGDHFLNVDISDGAINTSKEWKISVRNENRKPEFNIFPITVQEGERIVLDLPVEDVDGDGVNYSFEAPFTAEGVWATTYNDSGRYKIEIIASDGELDHEEEIEITVLDVDRVPILTLPQRTEVREGETLLAKLDATDPDGDAISFTFQDLPSSAKFNQRNMTLTWIPSYDTISRKGGFLSNLLNSLRAEHFFLRKKEVQFNVTACGKESCSSQVMEVMVYNTNRPPSFTQLRNVTVTELEAAVLVSEAIDPDGDIIRYYFTPPLGRKNGKWETGMEDRGNYTAYVTATDGLEGQTTPVEIKVLKKNREPTLRIRDDDITVNEGQQFLLRMDAADVDEDAVMIGLKNPPKGSSFKEGEFIWEPPYNSVVNRSTSGRNDLLSKFSYLNKKFSDEKATIWLEFTANDGEAEVVHPVKVTIKNVNQKPIITGVTPALDAKLQLNEPVLFQAITRDEDHDILTYEWDFGAGNERVYGTNMVRRTFTSPGMKEVKVTVGDGREAVEQVWKLNVEGKEYVPPPVAVPAPTFKVYVIKS